MKTLIVGDSYSDPQPGGWTTYFPGEIINLSVAGSGPDYAMHTLFEYASKTDLSGWNLIVCLSTQDRVHWKLTESPLTANTQVDFRDMGYGANTRGVQNLRSVLKGTSLRHIIKQTVLGRVLDQIQGVQNYTTMNYARHIGAIHSWATQLGINRTVILKPFGFGTREDTPSKVNQFLPPNTDRFWLFPVELFHVRTCIVPFGERDPNPNHMSKGENTDLAKCLQHFMKTGVHTIPERWQDCV